MADTRSSGRSTRHSPPRARPSRMDGIIGRLVYVPAQNDQGVGRLHRTRTSNQTPRFQQVTGFTQWCPPTRAGDSQASGLPAWRLARSQKNWLQNNYPEACIADEETEALLLSEIASAGQSAPRTPTWGSASLLALGDITDFRDEARAVRYPAMAVASGESGHVLRIVGLAKEEWSWESADVIVTTTKPNSHLSGEWCQDSQPITLIAFATHGTKREPIRWLIMQKATSTTICEPEIMAVSGFAEPTRATSRILPNPLVTIRSDQTGRAPHAHFSFKKVLHGESPRLAIIDKSGNWSVWDIVGRRLIRPKAINPVMLMCGNIVRGSLSSLTPIETPGQGFRTILWLTIDQTTREEDDGSETLPAKSGPEHDPGLRSQALLMCTSTGVYLFDMAARILQPVTRVVLITGSQQVLDVKPSPLQASQAFILTNTSLLWVKAKEATRGKLSLGILASCYHRRDRNDPGLRLEISPLAFLSGQKAFFVCIRSAKDTRMTIIWFTNLGEGMPAQYHHDILSLQSPSSFAGMEMIPVHRATARFGEGRTLLARENVGFFQVVAMGQDLSVNSTLCVWLDEPGAKVSAPDVLVSDAARKQQRRERKKLLRTIGDAFVIPDRYEGGLVHREAEDGGEMHTRTLEPPPQKVVNLRLLSLRSRRVRDGATSPKEYQQSGFSLALVSKAVQHDKVDGVMPRRSLSDLIGRDWSTEELLGFIEDWENRPGFMEEENGLQTLQTSYRASGSRIDDLIASLEKAFVEPVRCQDDQERQHRQRYIRRLAAEVFLSEVGVTTEADEGAGVTDALGGERRENLGAGLQSSLSFRSSPPLEASQEEPELPRLTEEEQPVSVRLRQYVPMNPILAVKPVETAVVSHWGLGANTSQIDWNPVRPQTADEMDSKRRRRMGRSRRRAEELASRGLSDSTAVAESQPVPIITASQPREISYTAQSSQTVVAPSQPMSQIVPGAYGGRPQKKAQKKGKGGFR